MRNCNPFFKYVYKRFSFHNNFFVKLLSDERKCCQLDYMKRKIYLTLLRPLLSHVERRPRGEVLPRKVLNDEVSDTTADAIKNKSSLNKNSQNSQHTFSQNIGKLPKCWESLAMKNLRFVKA